MTEFDYVNVPAHYVGDAASEEGTRIIARGIAAEITTAARGSGEDPVAWITGNSYFPPLRAFPGAEAVWQDQEMTENWSFLYEIIEWRLNEAGIVMDTGPDGSLFAVDLNRWEYDEEYGEESPTLSGEWKPKI